jgi:N4-gp56 family major capsid protein
MANTAFSPSGSVTTTTAANFIPEIWSDEIIAAYKKNLVLANLVMKMNFKGKKGDTVHIPAPTRGSASAKVATDAVTLIAATESEVQVSINKHYEYSRLIEDIVEAQALNSMRQFYTADAGYALARQVDTDLIQLGRSANGGTAGSARYDAGFIGGDGTTTFDYTQNTNTGNATALTDSAIRRTIQRLDDNDTPMDGRFFIIPPSSRNTLMGLARYTEQAFVGNGDAIRNGEIGNLYGIPVFTSSNADSASATAAFPTSGSAIARVCLMGHKDSMVLVEQVGIRSQVQYKQEYLATLFTSDTLYGVAALRNAASVGAAKSSSMFALVVPS